MDMDIAIDVLKRSASALGVAADGEVQSDGADLERHEGDDEHEGENDGDDETESDE